MYSASFLLDGLDGTGLQGFGNPKIKKGQHTDVQLIYGEFIPPKDRKDSWRRNEATVPSNNGNPQISLRGITLKHVNLTITSTYDGQWNGDVALRYVGLLHVY